MLVVAPLRRRGDSPLRLQGSPTSSRTSSSTRARAVAATAERISPIKGLTELLAQAHDLSERATPALRATASTGLTGATELRILLHGALPFEGLVRFANPVLLTG